MQGLPASSSRQRLGRQLGLVQGTALGEQQRLRRATEQPLAAQAVFGEMQRMSLPSGFIVWSTLTVNALWQRTTRRHRVETNMIRPSGR